jgi:hypothetical protein
LSLPDVQSRIEARVKDAFSLTNLEVIGTLVSQMRADITDLLDENGTVDLVAIKDKRLGHLIRKIRIARAWRPDGTKLEVISLDLHSAQAAAIQLSKILGLEEEARDQAKRAAIRLNVTRAVQRIAEKFDLTFEEAKAMYLRAAPHQARFL